MAKGDAKSKAEKLVAAQAKKSQKFKDRAVRFMNRALPLLGQIAALSDRKQHVYDPTQAKKIVDALKSAVERVEKRFETAGDAKSDNGFSL